MESGLHYSLISVPQLFNSEYNYVHSQDYIHRLKTCEFLLPFRCLAISLILKASCSLDPLISCLATNYVDRFISSRITTEVQNWVIKLLGISCLSVAAKIQETELWNLSDFMEKECLPFNHEAIARMELQILSALNWKMNSITPFSFIPYFMSLLELELEEPTLLQAIKDQTSTMTIRALEGIRFLEFKPSLIAAAALLSAAREQVPSRFPSLRNSILSCGHVDKENLRKCCNAMHEMLETESESTVETESSK